METLLEWLPKIGAGLTLVIGLVGFFRPRLILDSVGISLDSPTGWSEARAVFGGMNLGLSVAALAMGEPAIFTAIGVAWATLFLARLWSLAVDSIGLKASVPGLVVDGTLAFLFLSPLILA